MHTAPFGNTIKNVEEFAREEHGQRIDRTSLAANITHTLATARWGRKQINREAASATVGHTPVEDKRSPDPHVSPLPVRHPPPCKMWDDADIEESTVPEPEPEPEPVPEEAPVAEAEPEPEPVVVTEPKKLIFKHWVRPKFLQYNYMYDYRHNYYNDVINYLDRRNKGVITEKPRAQTWGERALRTYMEHANALRGQRAVSRDAALLRAVSTGARFHRYHSKSLISRKYSKLGFNTVSI